jgi:sigma-B regulation protein RsbU (phosphoserine phosphatase)
MNSMSKMIVIPELGIFCGKALNQTSRRKPDSFGSQMQSTLVPPLSYRGSQIEAHGQSLPKDDVGGDLMDVVASGDDVTAYVADVSGHGFRAGVLMGMVKTAVRYGLLLEQPLTKLLDDLNRVLPSVKEQHMFATLAALRFNNTGGVEYVSAGHVPLLHYRQSTGDVVRYCLPQLPLGLIAGDGYSSTMIPCEPGDIFAIVTDGVLERSVDSDPDSGLDEIAKLLRNNAGASLSDLAELIYADIARCGKQRDDETVLLLRTREDGKESSEEAASIPQREFTKHSDILESTWRRLLDDLAEELSHE